MNFINRVPRLSGHLAAVALAATLALLLAACGGGHSDIGGGGGVEPNATRAGASSSAPALGTGGPFCGAARKFESDQQVIHQAERASVQGGSAAGSAAVLSAVRDSEATLTTLQAQAPGSLKQDMGVVAAGWKPFFDTLIQAQGDMTKVPASVERNMQATVARPAFRAVDGYEVRTCHFQPSAH